MKQKADPKACSLNERVLVIDYSLARRTNQPGKKEKAAGISSSGLSSIRGALVLFVPPSRIVRQELTAEPATFR